MVLVVSGHTHAMRDSSFRRLEPHKRALCFDEHGITLKGGATNINAFRMKDVGQVLPSVHIWAPCPIFSPCTTERPRRHSDTRIALLPLVWISASPANSSRQVVLKNTVPGPCPQSQFGLQGAELWLRELVYQAPERAASRCSEFCLRAAAVGLLSLKRMCKWSCCSCSTAPAPCCL